MKVSSGGKGEGGRGNTPSDSTSPPPPFQLGLVWEEGREGSDPNIPDPSPRHDKDGAVVGIA